MVILIFRATAGPPYDFCTYYTAGLVAQETGSEDVYDLGHLNRRHKELHPDTGLRIGGFYYSPIYLAPATLLSRLDFDSSRMANQFLTLLALGGLLFLLLERTPSLTLRVLLCLCFVVADPVSNQFIYQNWSAFLALFVALAMTLTLRGALWPAALFWALAMHLKVYTALFLLPLLFIGRRKLTATALAAALALAVLSLPWVGLGAYGGYLAEMKQEAGGGVTYFFNQISLQGTIGRYFFSPPDWVTSNKPLESPLLQYLFWLSLPFFAAALYYLRKDQARALALTVPYLLLFIPKIWDHTEILFFTLFSLAALPRRFALLSTVYLCVSWSYFPLVQHLLLEVLQGQRGPGVVHALLLFYPFLNLLAAAVILAPPQGSAPTAQTEGAALAA
jgi:hypothetical protein